MRTDEFTTHEPVCLPEGAMTLEFTPLETNVRSVGPVEQQVETEARLVELRFAQLRLDAAVSGWAS